jgi:hypothetical protein
MWRRVGIWLALPVMALAAPAPAAQFSDWGTALGIPGAAAAAWGDCNRDGSPDLFLSSNALLENRGAAGFQDVTALRGIPSAALPQYAVAWGDYDNDGDLDLFVACDQGPPRLYRNDGLRFLNVAAEVGLDDSGPARGVSWCDYDGDNWLDLLVCFDDEVGAGLYRNNGYGSFTDVTEIAGLTAGQAPTWAIACAWGDVDNDTYPDLLVTRAAARPCLYLNNRNGAFTEIGLSAGLGVVNDATGAAWGDYDNDGLRDLYLASALPGPDWLLHNHGDGTFSDVTAAAGMAGDAYAGTGVVWFDYDNDTHLDLYVGNAGADNHPFLYHNNGDGTFTEVAADAGVAGASDSRAACWADVDRNGRVDLFSAADRVNSCLFGNQGPVGNHLYVRTVTDADGNATDPNIVDDRDAIGAFVEVNLDNDIRFPPGRTLASMVDGGSGLWAQSQQLAHFGLAGADLVAARVFFPDGTVVGHNNIPANQTFTIYDTGPPTELHLYAGTGDPGLVYAYQGDMSWVPICQRPLGATVYCLAQYQGNLYAGVGSELGVGQVYRYDGQGWWSLVGDRLDDAVTALALYQGHLYAGTAWNGMSLYRYDGACTWTRIAQEQLSWSGVGALHASGYGFLQIGDNNMDVLGRYDTRNFGTDGDWGGCCIYDFAEYDGALFAGAFMGVLYRSGDGVHWVQHRGFLPCVQILELQPFQGYLYTGSDNNGAGGLLARTRWPGSPETVWTSDDSISAMTADGDRAIFFGGASQTGGVAYRYTGLGAPAPIGAHLGGRVAALYFSTLFSDLPSDFWAVDYITACVRAGIVAGYPDVTYRPHDPVDRASMAVFISRALAGVDANIPPPPEDPTFSDVPSTHWAYRYVEYVHSLGIVQGYGNDYRPNERVDRAQMAVFLSRALAGGDANVPDAGCTTPPFTDVACSHWARKYIQFAKQAGVVSGFPDGSYRPAQTVNRAQMAVFIVRAFDLLP